MKIKDAKISNFQLLKDLKLDFSVDETKNVTIIKAENDSGKSTIMRALKWAFFGDSEINLANINLTHNDSPKELLETRVEINYFIETLYMNELQTKEFKLIRTRKANERKSILKIYKAKPNNEGLLLMDYPDLAISAHMVREVEELYFIDGDYAREFMYSEKGPSAAERRQNVEKAIRNVLGIKVIEKLENHVKAAKNIISKKAVQLLDDEMLKQAEEDKVDSTTELDKLREDLKIVKEEIANLRDKEDTYDLMYEEEMNNGKSKLVESRNDINESIRILKKSIDQSYLDLRKLLNSSKSYVPLLDDHIEGGLNIIQKLKTDGLVPRQMIPVLRSRLDKGVCICGDSLEGDCNEHKVTAINKLIEFNENADELSNAISELNTFAVEHLQDPAKGLDYKNFSTQWEKDFKSKMKDIFKTNDSITTKSDQVAELEKQIELSRDGNLDVIKSTRKQIKQQLPKLSDKRDGISLNIGVKVEEFKRADRIYRDLLDQSKLSNELKGENSLVNDTLEIIQESLNKLSTSELDNLSKMMNDIFIKNFGSSTILYKTYISDKFEIVVESKSGSSVNVQHALNGGNKRTLTISFILALMRLTNLQAPNFIDTPFATMDVQTKSRAFKLLATENSQVILFLTSSEISNIEGLINNYTNVVYTLTNSGHYGEKLVNKTDDGGISQTIRCECDLVTDCPTCKRIPEPLEVSGTL